MTGTGGNDCLTTVEHICPSSSQPFNVPLDAFITSHFASEADNIYRIFDQVSFLADVLVCQVPGHLPGNSDHLPGKGVQT